jgi:hypothetical protein
MLLPYFPLLPPCYWLLDLLFNPEDGGGIFLRNVGEFMRDYNGVTDQKL